MEDRSEEDSYSDDIETNSSDIDGTNSMNDSSDNNNDGVHKANKLHTACRRVIGKCSSFWWKMVQI